MKRTACIGTILLAAVANLPGAARATDKVAIVDVAFDTRDFIDRFEESDVLVVGRYYARCPQPELGLTTKRLVDQGDRSAPDSEISQLLSNGIAILSIYQYYNNSAGKFRGRKKDGSVLKDADCNATSVPRDAQQEASLDAQAAVKQAQSIGQPAGSAIYFGVDFNFSASDTETIENMISYFREVREIVTSAGYKVGAYGSGLALQTLMDASDNAGNKGLIDFAWISASRAFANSSAMHRSKQWHLFQNQVDREWFGDHLGNNVCTAGIPLDTNIQNIHQEEFIGFWNADGPFTVPSDRNREIFEARRFACDGNAIVRRASDSQPHERVTKRTCHKRAFKRMDTTIAYANAARLGTLSASAELVEIDADDDGLFDGWTWVGNLTGSFNDKPDWIFSSSARRNKKCDG